MLYLMTPSSGRTHTRRPTPRALGRPSGGKRSDNGSQAETRKGATTRSRRIGLVGIPGGQSLDLVGALEVFSTANQISEQAARSAGRASGAPPYKVELLARKLGALTLSSGLRLMPDRRCESVSGRLDTLLVAGGPPAALKAAMDDKFLRWLRRMEPRTRRLGSVCTGAFFLAEAGLLDGRRATTHWAAAERLARYYPAIDVEPDAIFLQDGHIYTSAGVSAGMDLALALVEEDLGRRVALATARQLVLFLKRPGGQSQFSTQLESQTRASEAPDNLVELADWILDHLDADLAVAALASRAAMSERNFARVFRRNFGVTPAKFVERARVERARLLLEEESQTLDQVACDAGFGSTERMRRSFARQLRVVPDQYRRHFESA